MPNIELLARVSELRDLRALEASAKAARDVALAQFKADNAALFMAADAASEAADAADTALRAVAQAEYDRTLNKNLCPGIQVREFQVLAYDPEKAYAWATETGLALKPASLDVKAFEKVAKATPLPFVTIKAEGRVQVMSDLDKALSGVEATEGAA